MILEIIKRKINQVRILENNWMNYFTEFVLYINIVLILYMFCTKILFFTVDVRRFK